MIQLEINCPKCNKSMCFLLTESGPQLLKCASCGDTLAESTPVSGFLYAIRNEAMPGLLKIGFTSRSVQERISEFDSSTVVPTPFETVFYFACSEPQSDEALAHEVLTTPRRKYDNSLLKDCLMHIFCL